MTREKAIVLIECAATELVGTMMQTKEPSAIEQLQRYVDAYDMAISALREQEERSKGCEYCNDILEYNKTHTFPKYVSPFCPVCGRRLEEV